MGSPSKRRLRTGGCGGGSAVVEQFSHGIEDETAALHAPFEAACEPDRVSAIDLLGSMPLWARLGDEKTQDSRRTFSVVTERWQADAGTCGKLRAGRLSQCGVRPLRAPPIHRLHAAIKHAKDRAKRL